MLAQKTSLNEEMEAQNKRFVVQLGDLKRTVSEQTNKIQALNQEHHYDIENLMRDLNDKHFAEVQKFTENEQMLR